MADLEHPTPDNRSLKEKALHLILQRGFETILLLGAVYFLADQVREFQNRSDRAVSRLEAQLDAEKQFNRQDLTELVQRNTEAFQQLREELAKR